MGCESRLLGDFLKDGQTVRQAVVEANGHAAGRNTDELLQFWNVERVVGLQQEVLPSDSKNDFFLLIDDVRRKE